MTVHAADLLEQSLCETATAADLPAASVIVDAVDEALARQEDVYDRILLPRLGLGERFDIHPHCFELDEQDFDFYGGEIWGFDQRPDQSWLHAPLLVPFQDIDDTLILVRRADVPAEVAARLRPPLVPGVRRALEALDWLVVDTGGYEGGRMQHDEFLDEIGERRWYRIDHDPDTGAVRFEQWRGEEPTDGWSANVFDAFECQLDPRVPVRAPAVVAEAWSDDPAANPFAMAVRLDWLDDPYAILRRLLWHDAGLDVDRLGPLLTWKDHPDALFEFTDAEDSRLAHLPAWLADALGADADALTRVVDDWFARILDSTPVEFPFVGTLHQVVVPPVELRRPAGLVGRPRHVDRRVRLDDERLVVATARPTEQWLDNDDAYR